MVAGALHSIHHPSTKKPRAPFGGGNIAGTIPFASPSFEGCATAAHGLGFVGGTSAFEGVSEMKQRISIALASAMRALLLSGICAVMIAGTGSAFAVEILKKEPLVGAMRPGTPVYVDDGTCPKGQVKEVLSGVMGGSGKSARAVQMPRTRRCVPRPS
jgi:uncharacterized protein DUF6719